MLMDQLVWHNTLNLLRLRVHGSRWLKPVLIVLPIVLFIINLMNNLSAINDKRFFDFNGFYTGDYYVQIWDPSTVFTIVILIWVIVMTCMYHSQNASLDAYPQTNVSRFLSQQLMFGIVIVYSGIVCLVFNLLEHAIYSVISSGRTDLTILSPLNMAAQIKGFLIYLLFLLFHTALISLIASAVRRYKYIALIGLLVAAAYFVATAVLQSQIFYPVIDFLQRHSTSLLSPLFFIVAWLIIVIGTLSINKHAAYYKTERNRFGIAASVIAIICFLIFFTPFTFLYTYTYPRALGTELITYDDYYKASENRETIVIDAAEVQSGSKLNIVSKNFINTNWEETTSEETTAEIDYQLDVMDMQLWYPQDELDTFTGKKITVNVHYPLIIYNGYNISKVMNPKVTARLEGDTLYLDYKYTKSRSLILPCWGMVMNSAGMGSGNTVVSIS